MRKIFAKKLFRESIGSPSSSASISETLRTLPSMVAGKPAYLLGVMLDFKAKLDNGNVSSKTATQRQIAKALGAITISGNGVRLAENLRGDALLVTQSLLGFGTAYKQGSRGFVCDTETVTGSGQTTVYHTVVIPAAVRPFQLRPDISAGDLFDGAIDACVLGANVQVEVTGVGADIDSDLTFSAIEVEATAIMGVGPDLVAPQPFRTYTFGAIDKDPYLHDLGSFSRIHALAVMSDAVPTSNEDQDLSIRSADGSIWAVEVDGRRILDVTGSKIMSVNAALGMDWVRYLDDETSVCTLVAPTWASRETEVHAGRQLKLVGWNSEDEDSLGLLCTRDAPSRELMSRWAELRGVKASQPLINGRPAATVGLDGGEAVGVPVEYPAK